jgi:hypothetical protein
VATHFETTEQFGSYLSARLSRELAEPRPIPDTQPSENGDCGLCGEQLLDTDQDGFTEFYDGEKRILAHGQCGIDAGLEMG